MSSVCPCCGQIVGSIPARRRIEILTNDALNNYILEVETTEQEDRMFYWEDQWLDIESEEHF